MAWCLSFHADYKCRHSGACCREGWAIPFDPDEAARVEALPLTGSGGLVRPRGADNTAFALTTADGACSFFEPGERLCGIHRAGGHRALPLTCQMFPRLMLRDPRGAFVSLSHFCPTAAALLFNDPGPVAIVEAPESLVGDIARLDGLDATDTWPPLLRKGLLMDVESYGIWERHAIDALTRDAGAPWRALDRIEGATSALLDWSPAGGPASLAHQVEASFAPERHAAARTPDGALWKLVREAVPNDLKPSEPVRSIDQQRLALGAMERYSAAVCRWLAARLFGTWIAYQGTGLRTIVGYLRAALDVLVVELARGAADGVLDQRATIEAVRRSDLLLIHRAGSERLATLLS